MTDQENLFYVDDAGMGKPLDKTAGHSLHICPDCGSKLVQPTRWKQERDRSHWRVWRRCPECEWTCDSVHDELEVDAFDEQLDLGAHALADELQALEHANMTEMAASFIAALSHDLISADDFA
jgi:predicted RNA-binding Zn-ribbon protein involved in translation (DUF1610 family)